MNSSTKYLFDRSFEPDVLAEQARLAETPPEPPPPSFSEAELAQARDAAYMAGLMQGRAEMAESQNQQLVLLLQHLSQLLQQLSHRVQHIGTTQQHQAMQAAMAIARKLLPSFISRHGGAELEPIFAQALSELRHEPRLLIRLADSDLAALQPKLEAMAGALAFSGQLVWLADSSLHAGDCRIEWADGGLERQTEPLWLSIEHILQRAFVPTEAHAQTHAPPHAHEMPAQHQAEMLTDNHDTINTQQEPA